MLAPPHDVDCFLFLGGRGFRLLSDQDVTQDPLQTYGCAEERAAQICKGEASPSCLHPWSLQLRSPARRTGDTNLC